MAGATETAGTTSGRGALAALGGLCLLYVALAALPAADGSNVVLATAGGSPDWLLGPLRAIGGDWTDGALGGPLFYAGLWLALALWALVVARADRLARRTALWAVVAAHVLFLLAPPLLSQDVFSYIAYARLGVEHDLNPYEHAPAEIPGDPVHPHAGSKSATSAYGPLFTLGTYPLSGLGVPTAFWILKIAAALASLALVGVVWRIAERLGRDPLQPALFVGLNPLTLVHVVGGAHNEAYVVLLTMLGVLAWAGGRAAAGGALATLAVGLKASAGLVIPFLFAAGPRRGVLAGALAAGVAIVAAAFAGFGADALDALGLLSDNQERSSRWSFPYKTAELLGAVLPGDRLDYRGPVRAAYAAAFAGVALWLLLRTWRGADPVAAAGWATLALLVASAWLVPWYALWLLPLAALANDRRLELATGALCAWMLVIAVPL
ncbi:MAG: alpha,6-mannosyltransferase [Thermoleophilaceae bacterium]|nr:alpha,6-mannosyltransferase [Thermoleophilaceae bacterium]